MSKLPPSFVVLRPVTPRGKYAVARMLMGGEYAVICECRSEFHARNICTALRMHEHSVSLVQIGEKAS